MMGPLMKASYPGKGHKHAAIFSMDGQSLTIRNTRIGLSCPDFASALSEKHHGPDSENECVSRGSIKEQN